MYSIREISILTGAAILPAHTKQHDTTIQSVDFDTRRLRPGSLFVALTIGTTDGHTYIEQAIQNGATAALISDPAVVGQTYSKDIAFLLVDDTLSAFQDLASAHRLMLDLPVIGITGSNGKTTSKDMVSHLLSHKLSVHKTQGNFNNHLGVPLTLLQARPDHDVIILEMGMNHAGELDILGFISKPDYVIITNIGESHIEHLGSREGIAHAKGEALTHLKAHGKAFLPGDSEFKDLLAEKTQAEVIYFQADETVTDRLAENQLTAQAIHSDRNGTRFQFQQGTDDALALRIPLFGLHNVQNALPAVFLAKEFGFSDEEIIEGMNGLVISPMRFQLLTGKNGVTLINDAYNASPTSMTTSTLTFLNTFTEQKRIVALGDMYELGPNTLELHRQVGLALNKVHDQIECLITIGEHSRTLSSVFDGVCRHFDTKEEATAYIRTFQHSDFALFFKASRGMGLETIVNTFLVERNISAI